MVHAPQYSLTAAFNSFPPEKIGLTFPKNSFHFKEYPFPLPFNNVVPEKYGLTFPLKNFSAEQYGLPVIFLHERAQMGPTLGQEFPRLNILSSPWKKK